MEYAKRESGILQALQLRATIIHHIRRFFWERGYLEVETPVRIKTPAPEANIDAIQAGEWFLQTSPELCMKRLTSEGFHQIYQICRCFRDNERGDRHLPEFTLLEWYHAGYTYLDLMQECEQLLNFVVQATHGRESVTYLDDTIDISAPFSRLQVEAAFDRYASISMAEALRRDTFDECMAFEIEPHLGKVKPLFLYDYPIEKGALARRHPQKAEVAERFELYIAGIELCNAFTELTDPVEQRRRFEHELDVRRKNSRPHYPMPEKFLAALPRMPAMAGNAMGIDRLVMILANARQIDDVAAFVPEAL